VRRDGIERLKKLEKDSKISEDDSRRAQEEVQHVTDELVRKIDEILVLKEKEIMEV